MATQDEEQEQRKKQRREDGGATPRGSAPPPPADAGAVPACSSRLHTPAVPGRRRLVLVFDLDETLLIFNSLLSGTWAAAHQLQDDPAAVSQLLELGSRWEAAIMRLCDDRFFFEELEEYDQTCLADIQQYDDGASLSGYPFSADGFPPPSQRHAPHSPQEHTLAAHPAPHAAASAAAASSSAASAAAIADDSASSREPAVGAAAGSQAAGTGAGAEGGGPPAHPLPGSQLDSPACHSLDAASLRRLAYRFRRISLLFKFGLSALGSASQRQEWESLYRETDKLTGGWLSHANSLLTACTAQLGGSGLLAAAAGSSSSGGSGSSSAAAAAAPEVVHVAVTSGQLIPSLAKLLLFQLSGHIQSEHVWSSRYRGKQHCFELVRQRFGPDSTYVAIGDGIEEDKAAAALGWPYVRVLLAPAEQYPAARVLCWRPCAATGDPGLPFTQLTVHHIAKAAGLGSARPRTPAEGAHGGSAASAALVGAEGAYICCI